MDHAGLPYVCAICGSRCTNQEKCAAAPVTSSSCGLNFSKTSNVFSNPSHSAATFGSIALSSGSTSMQITIGNFSMSQDWICGDLVKLFFCQIVYRLNGVRQSIQLAEESNTGDTADSGEQTLVHIFKRNAAQCQKWKLCQLPRGLGQLREAQWGAVLRFRRRVKDGPEHGEICALPESVSSFYQGMCRGADQKFRAEGSANVIRRN